MFRYGFEVGDTVQFKSWDELRSEYGESGDGLRAPLFFNRAMKYLCGRVVHIKTLKALQTWDEFTTEEDIEVSEAGRKWYLSTDFIKPYGPEIHTDVSEPEWSEVLGF